MPESDSWNHLTSSLAEDNKEVSLYEYDKLIAWIKGTIEGIEKINFTYYTTSYVGEEGSPVKDEDDEQRTVEVAILFKRMIFLFTVYPSKREFSAFSINKLDGVIQTLNEKEEEITTIFLFQSSQNQFYLKDRIDSTALPNFTKNVLGIWEKNANI